MRSPAAYPLSYAANELMRRKVVHQEAFEICSVAISGFTNANDKEPLFSNLLKVDTPNLITLNNSSIDPSSQLLRVLPFYLSGSLLLGMQLPRHKVLPFLVGFSEFGRMDFS